MCPNAGNSEAAKVCFDHCISISFATDSPPPLYLCIECANEIQREHPNQMFYDILHPMQQVSISCENKVNCKNFIFIVIHLDIFLYILYLNLLCQITSSVIIT